jgi:hypothetical protein
MWFLVTTNLSSAEPSRLVWTKERRLTDHMARVWYTRTTRSSAKYQLVDLPVSVRRT